jgi:hypothetical protein
VASQSAGKTPKTTNSNEPRSMGTRVKEEGKDAHTVVNVSLDVGDWLGAFPAFLG